MARPPSLRQIEAFKAVIETGTASQAAEALGISQPAASKLIAHLEADTDLQLFERERGRLRPTERGRRLYNEIDRIFSGLEQIQRVIESIRREEQGELLIGVMPGLSGRFICTVVERFLDRNPGVYISLSARSSQFIIDWLSRGQLDVGIVAMRVDGNHLESEPLLKHPIICATHPDHPLAQKEVVRPEDLVGEPFISFARKSHTRRQIDQIFDTRGLKLTTIVEATTAANLCEFVASGLGVTLAHPLLAQATHNRIAMRPFEPATEQDFLMCRPLGGRHRRLVDNFMEEARQTASELSRQLVSSSPASSPR